MTFIYFKLLLPASLVFLALSLSADALGTAQPRNPALVGFVEGCEGKPPPCWYGIVPGATSVIEAVNLLAKAGYQLHYAINQLEARSSFPTTCEFDLPYYALGDVVRGFSVRKCGRLQLGDLFSVLGPPNIVYSCYDYSINNKIPVLNLQYKGTLLYQKVSERERSNNLALPSPYLRIETVNFSGLMVDGGADWHGFIAYWRYQQLEPDAADYC